MSFISKLGTKIGNAIRKGHRDGIPTATEPSIPTAAPILENRELSSEERQFIEWLLEHGAPDAKLYASQLPVLRVASRCGCGCPTIDLDVGDGKANIYGPSHILADFYGTTADGVEVGVILHAREGKIAELEIYPLGQTVTSLPRVESLWGPQNS
jgi:hypothetical protein